MWPNSTSIKISTQTVNPHVPFWSFFSIFGLILLILFLGKLKPTHTRLRSSQLQIRIRVHLVNPNWRGTDATGGQSFSDWHAKHPRVARTTNGFPVSPGDPAKVLSSLLGCIVQHLEQTASSADFQKDSSKAQTEPSLMDWHAHSQMSRC